MELTEKDFDRAVLEGEKPALVEFWAPWCVYCRRIAPAFKAVEAEYGDRLLMGQVNVDQEPGLEERFQVEVIPTLILFQGGRALGSITAPDSKAGIDAFIRRHLGA